MPKFTMYIPTIAEYNRLCKAAKDDDSIMHWDDLYSWVDKADSTLPFSSQFIVCGRYGSNFQTEYNAKIEPFVALRPAFQCLTPEELPDLNYGDTIIVGTLYMNTTTKKGSKTPSKRQVDIVRVPQEYKADNVARYYENTTLTLREAADEPNSAIWGIYISNNTFIADRPILKNITPQEFEDATFLSDMEVYRA